MRMHLPTHDRALAREVCAAAMFGRVEPLEWAIEVATMMEDYALPPHRAARMVNAERAIASDVGVVSAAQRDALRRTLDAAITGALGGRSGLVEHDVAAVLAMPRTGYPGVDQALCRDLVAILWPAWRRASRAVLAPPSPGVTSPCARAAASPTCAASPR